ncbi:hypothetical protein WKW80_32510 [Variovorax humicola]|uniref:Uncharacterized protein n=1 Tax=Variovorax humicola TaxID=1769758 RepID=A0ABU8WAZ7_9BURK
MSTQQPSYLLGEHVASNAAIPMPGGVAAASELWLGVRDEDLVTAVLLSIAGRRTLVPERVEVLPFLCSLADLFRHTLDKRIEVVVEVDRDCPAWNVDRSALEEALMQVVLNCSCAARRMGRMTLWASFDRRGSLQGTLLKILSNSSGEDWSSLEWRN